MTSRDAITRGSRVVQVVLGSLLVVTALNAFGGGVYGIAGARGVPVAWLAGSPFADYRLPGLILFALVGGSLTWATVEVIGATSRARRVAFGAGQVLVAWLAVQVAIIGYVSWLQPVVALIAASVCVLAWFTPRSGP